MRTTKKLLSLLLALCMVVSLLPATALAAEGTVDAATPTPKNVARIEQTGVEYPTLAAVSAAVSDNQTITMLENVDSHTDYFTFTNKKNITINLNGKTIKGSGDWAVVYCPKGSTVTIDGTVPGSAIHSYEVGATTTASGYATAVWSGTDSKVIINGGHYENLITTTQDDHFDLIYANGTNASIEILDGTFENFTPKWTLNLKDNSGASIEVKGGSYDRFDPSAGDTEPAPNNPKNYLAEGYVSVANGDKFDVKPLADVAVAKIGDKYYRTLEDALNEAVDGNTVMVLKDATIGKAVEIDAGTIEVNLNGKTVSYVPSKSNDDLAIIDINGSANVTVTGNGSFTFTNDYFTSKMDELGYIFRLSGDASLTIENGNYHAVLTCVQAGENATATIQGGIFSTEIEWNGTRWHLNLIDKSNAKIIVTGGTFVEYDPSNGKNENPAANFVDPNYIVTQEGNNYLVQKIENKLVVDKGTVSGNTQSATLAGDFAPNAPVEGDNEGSEVRGYDVSLDLSNDGGNTADTVNLTVTKETAKSLVSADSLSVATDVGTVELNAAALDKVGKTEGDVVITVQKNTVDSSDNVKASYTVSVKTGETNLLPYGESNGKVTITVPKGDATVAWYVTGDNTSKVYVEKLDTRETDGKIAITIGHLSTIEMLAADPETTAVATVTVNGKTTGYNTFSDALNAAAAGSTIKLLKDVDSENTITVPDGVTLDGNGKTLKYTGNRTDATKPNNGAFITVSKDGADVVIKNITINAGENIKHGVQFYCVDGGKLEEATINGAAWTSVIVNGSKNIEMKNCTFNPADTAYANIEYAMGKNVTTVPSMTLDNVSFDSSKPAVWADKDTVERMVNANENDNITADTVVNTVTNNVISKNNSSFEIAVQIKPGEGGITTTTKPSTIPTYTGPSGYAVKTETGAHGKLTVSSSYATKGTTVTVTVTPDKGYVLSDLTVTDKNGNALTLTDKGNGKYTFVMPEGAVTVKAAFGPESLPFTDVSLDAYYANAVKWAVDKGVTSGLTATTFGPNVSCTRAQVVTFLWRAAGSPVVNYAMKFTDVPADAYYAEAVRWAVSKGITAGVTETTFGPEQTVTRAQVVAFLYRQAGSPAVGSKNPFTDVAADMYYADAVKWAVAQKITAGTTDTTFSPNADCTRGQIVTFLYNDMAK